MWKYFTLTVPLLCIILAAPQQPEINDQYETTENINDIVNIVEAIKILNTNESNDKQINKTVQDNEITTKQVTITKTENKTSTRRTEIAEPPSFTKRMMELITAPFVRIISLPKVKIVLKDVGTCIVNGVMEIVSYYVPAPLIPLIATAAGMVIPFEPVVMLRQKMPVTSYRRAFKSALDGFLGTFDRYKDFISDDVDPYRTRRFNRRFLNDDSDRVKTGAIKYVD